MCFVKGLANFILTYVPNIESHMSQHFENTTLNPDLHSACIKQAIDYSFCTGKLLQAKSMKTMQVQWIKPREGWFKLNTDGASLGNLKKDGGGGLVRDHKGGMAERI